MFIKLDNDQCVLISLLKIVTLFGTISDIHANTLICIINSRLVNIWRKIVIILNAFVIFNSLGIKYNITCYI
jgi:hypothetical protein